MIYFDLNVPLYRQQIRVLFVEETDNYEDCDKFIRNKVNCTDPIVTERRGDACVTPVYYNPGICFIVTVFILEDSAYFNDTIAHEISHLCFEIFDCVGIPMNKDTNEAFAYLNGYITRLFYERLDRELNKRKKKRAKQKSK